MLRLYAEDTQPVRLQVSRAIVKGLLCTQFKAKGSWEGKKEKALVIETTDENLAKLRDLAASITFSTRQDETLLVRLASERLDPICA